MTFRRGGPVALVLVAGVLLFAPAAAEARAVHFKVSAIWAPATRFTVVKKLTLTRVPGDASVELRCKGTGCPFKRKAVRATGLAVRFRMRSDRAPKKTAQRIAAGPIADPTPPGPTAPAGERALAVARRYLGTSYFYGGATPATGFDSSGLTQYSYGEVGISLPRVGDDQCRAGSAASTSVMELGDLVCFGDSTGYIDHVGLYAGEGKFIHAPHTGDVVRYSSLSEPYYAARLFGARRFSG
jgi:cell wall-associated NlpC family hydrolase